MPHEPSISFGIFGTFGSFGTLDLPLKFTAQGEHFDVQINEIAHASVWGSIRATST
jgi:hypothetical protein